MKIVQLHSKRPEVYIVQNALKFINYDLQSDGNCGSITTQFIKDLQEQLNIKTDGKWGNDTWRKYLDKNSFQINPITWIHQIIGLFENSTTIDGYGFAENDIGDSAGANYGILQHNKLGSMKTLLKLANRPDLLNIYNSTNKNIVNHEIKKWFGSALGRFYQNKYFNKYIIDSALDELSQIKSVEKTPLSLGLFCDSRTQNGTQFSNRKPFFADKKDTSNKELIDGYDWDKQFPELPFTKWKNIWLEDFKIFASLPEKEAIRKTNILIMNHMTSLLSSQNRKLEVLAQYRARTSSYKYWKDVLSRRNIWAKGEGIVHGTRYNINTDFFYNNVILYIG